MARFEVPVANVAEAGDIVLLAMVLLMTFIVGAALLALDTVVGRLHARRMSKTPAPQNGQPGNGGGGP